MLFLNTCIARYDAYLVTNLIAIDALEVLVWECCGQMQRTLRHTVLSQSPLFRLDKPQPVLPMPTEIHIGTLHNSSQRLPVLHRVLTLKHMRVTRHKGTVQTRVGETIAQPI
jgi:hypothetical protein